MSKPQEFYVIYFIDKDCDVDGKHLERGYYRYVYDLTGVDLPNPCMYSKDRYEWSTYGMFYSLGEFQDFFEKMDPKPMKMDREDYIETITYRGVSVPIFCDDYGQCFYCVMDNEVMSFGSFQSEYEEEVKALIDLKLDGRTKKMDMYSQIRKMLAAADCSDIRYPDENIRTEFCNKVQCHNCKVCTPIPEGGRTYGDCRKEALRNTVEMAKSKGIQVSKKVEDLVSREGIWK